MHGTSDPFPEKFLSLAFSPRRSNSTERRCVMRPQAAELSAFKVRTSRFWLEVLRLDRRLYEAVFWVPTTWHPDQVNERYSNTCRLSPETEECRRPVLGSETRGKSG